MAIEKKKKNKREILVFKQFTIKQFISFILGILFFLTGISLLILYYIEEYAPIKSDASKILGDVLANFNSFTHTSLGFIGWGIISFLLGTLIIVLALSLSTKIEDREKEKKSRRELRLQALKEANSPIIQDVVSTSIEDNKDTNTTWGN